MTSYLRYIFGGYSRDSSPSREQSSKSHGRSHSHPTPNYMYATPGTASGAPTSPPRLKTKRSNSYSARTTTPSPLRYAFDTAAQVANPSGEVRYGTSSKAERSPLYRRASYKSSEHRRSLNIHPSLIDGPSTDKVAHYAMPHTTSMTPSVSFGPSSRTNSSSSLLPGSAPPGSSAGSSSHHMRYERRPSLRHNPAWQGSVSSATGSMHSRTSQRTHWGLHILTDPLNILQTQAAQNRNFRTAQLRYICTRYSRRHGCITRLFHMTSLTHLPRALSLTVQHILLSLRTRSRSRPQTHRHRRLRVWCFALTSSHGQSLSVPPPHPRVAPDSTLAGHRVNPAGHRVSPTWTCSILFTRHSSRG